MIIHYDVEYWDELDEKIEKDSGIVGAQSLGTGVEQVCDFYGGIEKICSINVYVCEEVITVDEMKDFINE